MVTLALRCSSTCVHGPACKAQAARQALLRHLPDAAPIRAALTRLCLALLMASSGVQGPAGALPRPAHPPHLSRPIRCAYLSSASLHAQRGSALLLRVLARGAPSCLSTSEATCALALAWVANQRRTLREKMAPPSRQKLLEEIFAGETPAKKSTRARSGAKGESGKATGGRLQKPASAEKGDVMLASHSRSAAAVTPEPADAGGLGGQVPEEGGAGGCREVLRPGATSRAGAAAGAADDEEQLRKALERFSEAVGGGAAGRGAGVDGLGEVLLGRGLSLARLRALGSKGWLLKLGMSDPRPSQDPARPVLRCAGGAPLRSPGAACLQEVVCK